MAKDLSMASAIAESAQDWQRRQSDKLMKAADDFINALVALRKFEQFDEYSAKVALGKAYSCADLWEQQVYVSYNFDFHKRQKAKDILDVVRRAHEVISAQKASDDKPNGVDLAETLVPQVLNFVSDEPDETPGLSLSK